MGRINADGQPLGLSHRIVNGREMMHAMAEATALPGRVLQCDSHGRSSGLGDDFIQASDDLLKSRFVSLAQMRARMQHHKRQTERSRKLNLLQEGLERLLAIGASRRW